MSICSFFSSYTTYNKVHIECLCWADRCIHLGHHKNCQCWWLFTISPKLPLPGHEASEVDHVGRWGWRNRWNIIGIHQIKFLGPQAACPKTSGLDSAGAPSLAQPSLVQSPCDPVLSPPSARALRSSCMKDAACPDWPGACVSYAVTRLTQPCPPIQSS